MGRRSRGAFVFHAVTLIFLGLGAGSAGAVPIGGIEFPAGPLSFVDSVVSFTRGSPAPGLPYRDPLSAVGTPDFAHDFNCAGDPKCSFVSLGVGGSIVLQFTDNSLTGSGDSANDLHIFETGPDIEDMFVDISKNGVDWFAIGKVLGATAGIDIDLFGFGPSDFFFFVRLTDDRNEGAVTGIRVGADIDAVGAITSGPAQPVTTTTAPPTETPEPATTLLLGAGLAAWVLFKKRRAD